MRGRRRARLGTSSRGGEPEPGAAIETGEETIARREYTRAAFGAMDSASLRNDFQLKKFQAAEKEAPACVLRRAGATFGSSNRGNGPRHDARVV